MQEKKHPEKKDTLQQTEQGIASGVGGVRGDVIKWSGVESD
jgi:hypothetical protein